MAIFQMCLRGQNIYGPDIGKTVSIYATSFPDMHRELEKLYVMGDVVIVELSLNGTQNGSLALAVGTIPASGNEMHTLCCDVFHLENGKVKSFHCYTAGTILFGQLGVFANLNATFQSPQISHIHIEIAQVGLFKPGREWGSLEG